MSHRASARAFTLIELLVVVAVIALLIAMLIPAISKAKQVAKQAYCATNLRTLAGMDTLYAMNWNGNVPRNADPIPSTFYLLATDQHVFLQTGTSDGKFESQYAAAYSQLKWLSCPSFPTTGQPVCFVVNAFDPSNIGNEIDFANVAQILHPSATANFCDGNQALPKDDFAVFDLWSTGHIALNPAPPVTTPAAIVEGGTAGRILSDNRHGTQINMSFYDEHVEAKAYKKVAITDFVN